MRTILINSDNRTNGTAENFNVRLNQGFSCEGYKLKHAQIAGTWYVVMTGINDKFYINAGSTDYTATLTQGDYTYLTLLTELQTQLNASYTPDNDFTVTFDTLTNKYTVTHSATDFIITFGTNTTASANKLFGFAQTDTTETATHTADYIFNLRHSENIIIASSELTGETLYQKDRTCQCIGVIPINGGYMDIISYDNNADEIVKFNTRYIDDIDIKIYFDDENMTLIPLNGGRVSLYFNIY